MVQKKNVVIIDHPLILDKLSRVRSINTQKKDFKENLYEIGSLMAFQVFQDLPLEKVNIETPIAKMVGYTLKQKIVLCPILRAGLGFVNAFEDLLPNAIVSHIGLYRNEKTLLPQEYFFKYPTHLNEKPVVYILDPMLATGGSAMVAIEKLLKENPLKISLVSLVASPEAIAKISAKFPKIMIYVVAIDEKLNEKGYIVPGLGDAGDRIFGTK